MTWSFTKIKEGLKNRVRKKGNKDREEVFLTPHSTSVKAIRFCLCIVVGSGAVWGVLVIWVYGFPVFFLYLVSELIPLGTEL